MYSLFTTCRRIVPGILIITSVTCTSTMTTSIKVSPKHFKVQVPFIINGRGLIINTYWGSKKEHHVLCLDNNSPSWIKHSFIQYNQSFVKSKNLSFKTSTADGSSIQGDVGICDSIFFDNLVFLNVPFYVMPDNQKDNNIDDGVFGIDAMSKGIWKIDFRKEELTFASDIKSFKEIRQSEIFPASFNRNSITVDVAFGDNNIKRMAIDLGYNDDMLLPLSEFKAINESDKIFIDSARFSTPASENIVKNLSAFDTVKINENWFFTMTSSNEMVKERLIGLKFFRKFDYVIFDFINKRIYIPKKVW